MIPLLLLLACSKSQVASDFEAARTAALELPGPVPTDWQPDAALHLSPSLVDAVVKVALEKKGRFDRPFDVAGPLGLKIAVTPDLTVQSLKLRSSEACASCLSVDTTIEGPVGWTTNLARGTVRVSVKAAVDAEFLVTSHEDGTFAATVRPADVRSVTVQLGDGRAGVPKLLEEKLAEKIKQKIAERSDPVPIGEFGAGGAPLRAVKLIPSPRGVSVAMLTAAPHPVPLADPRPKILDGWQLDISQGSLLSIAKAEGFRKGPVGAGVVVEPTALEIGRGTFSMGLRLWKPTGGGWWRDYTVHGDMALAENELALKAKTVTEGPKSEGAALADPLAALAEGYIVSVLEESVAATLPTAKRSASPGQRTEVRVTTLSGASGVLTAKGTLEITNKPPMSRPGKNP